MNKIKAKVCKKTKNPCVWNSVFPEATLIDSKAIRWLYFFYIKLN